VSFGAHFRDPSWASSLVDLDARRHAYGPPGLAACTHLLIDIRAWEDEWDARPARGEPTHCAAQRGVS
jgi:hypothetical protein